MNGAGFSYRPEIDGLRAISVVSVLLFHAGWSVTAGGYVGVDVFFVISGFLITSLILKEKQQGFSFAAFYERRIRRLLPPLIPVLTASCVGAFFLFPHGQFADFSNSFFATIALASNWYFSFTIGYFDGPADSKPLLHMWSLSIEEQYYLVWPALIVTVLWLSTRRVLFWVTAAITAASLLFGAWLISKGMTDEAFFNSFARFWEISTGALLAMAPAAHPKPRLAPLFGFGGLGLILAAIITDTGDMPFPGASAILATSGAALVILAGQCPGIVSTMLSSRPLVYVGKRSYALYLWHWPLLVFAWLLLPEAAPAATVGALLLSFAFSVLSYSFIEQPIRRKAVFPLRRDAYAFAVTGTAAFVAVLLMGRNHYIVELRTGMLYGDRAEILAAIHAEEADYKVNYNLNFTGDEGEFLPQRHNNWTCSFYKGNTVARVLSCLTAQAKSNNVLVIGDSVGRDTWHALKMAYPNRNFLMLHDSGCPPAEYTLTKGNITKTCFKGMGDLFEALPSQVKIDVVILAFRYKPPHWRMVGTSIAEVKRVFGKVMLFGVSPVFQKDIPSYLSDSADIPDLIRLDDAAMVQWDYVGFLEEARMIATAHAAIFVNIYPFYCGDKNCRVWGDALRRMTLFWDDTHLTPSGMREYSKFLAAEPVVRAELLQSATHW